MVLKQADGPRDFVGHSLLASQVQFEVRLYLFPNLIHVIKTMQWTTHMNMVLLVSHTTRVVIPYYSTSEEKLVWTCDLHNRRKRFISYCG